MRPDGGKEGEERMRFGEGSGIEGRFLFVCFVFGIEETKNVSKRKGRLKIEKKNMRLKI